MLHYLVQARLVRVLRRLAPRRRMPLVAGAMAFALTASMTVPVTAALVPATFLVPRRWRAIAAYGAFGSALGAACLLFVFHHAGWALIEAAFPQWYASPEWQRVIGWVARYGLVALFAVAALPLPQTPALILFAVSAHFLPGVVLAVFAGKLIKYGVVCGAIAMFPARFDRLRMFRLDGTPPDVAPDPRTDRN